MASEPWLHQAMQELGENGKEHILGSYILPIYDSFLILEWNRVDMGSKDI